MTGQEWLLTLLGAEGLAGFVVIVAVYLKVRRIDRAVNGKGNP